MLVVEGSRAQGATCTGESSSVHLDWGIAGDDSVPAGTLWSADAASGVGRRRPCQRQRQRHFWRRCDGQRRSEQLHPATMHFCTLCLLALWRSSRTPDLRNRMV